MIGAALSVVVPALAATSATSATSAAVSAALARTAAPDLRPCGPLRSRVYAVVNPQTRSTLLTLNQKVMTTSGAANGYTTHRGVLFYASKKPGKGLVRIVRLWSPSAKSYDYRRAGLKTPAGWQRQGTAFYASPTKNRCASGLRVYQRGGSRSFAISAFDRGLAEKYDWKRLPMPFYVAEAKPDRTFSLAVIPDTQTETHVEDPRFSGRTAWMVNHRADLDLRFALHTGDVVNWGWLEKSQYKVASEAMRNLERDDLPYALSIGNHDTRAVGWDGIPGSTGWGGSAYQDNPECPQRLSPAECDSNKLVRHTEEFNAVFTAARYSHVAGAYQKGRVDNIFTAYRAGGRKWLVLTLELWPRAKVVDWARRVVASHPRYNVIVQTHSYLDSDGKIGQSNGGYGANSPQYLTDRLISRFPNIRMVFCGHVGSRAQRVDTYRVKTNGQTRTYKVASFLGNNTTDGTNPVQLLEVNASRNTVISTVRNPAGGGGLSEKTYAVRGMNFLK